MIHSMTGYGKSIGEISGKKITVEIINCEEAIKNNINEN